MFAGELVQSAFEFPISLRRFGEVKRLQGRPLPIIEERNVMSISRGVDTDSEMDGS